MNVITDIMMGLRPALRRNAAGIANEYYVAVNCNVTQTKSDELGHGNAKNC
jgi:hypothetical protein